VERTLDLVNPEMIELQKYVSSMTILVELLKSEKEWQNKMVACQKTQKSLSIGGDNFQVKGEMDLGMQQCNRRIKIQCISKYYN
jgi:hypothetical protein